MKSALVIIGIVLLAILPLSTGNVLVVQSRNIIYVPATITPYQWVSINQTITYKDVTKLQQLDLEFIANGFSFPTDYANATETANSTYVDSVGIPVYDIVPRMGNESYAATVVYGNDSNVDVLDGVKLVFDLHPSDTTVSCYAIFLEDISYFLTSGNLVAVVNISVAVNVSGVVDIALSDTYDDYVGDLSDGDINNISSGNYTLIDETDVIAFGIRAGEYNETVRVEVDLAVCEYGSFRHYVSTSFYLSPIDITWKDTYYHENGTSVHITLNTTAKIQKIQCTFNGEDYTINEGETSDLGTLHMSNFNGGLQNITLCVNSSAWYLRFNFDGKNRWVDTGIATVHYVFLYDNSSGQFSRYIPMFGNYSPYINTSACSIVINNDTHTITVQWVIRLSPMAAAGQWTIKSTAYFEDGSIYNDTTVNVAVFMSYVVSPLEFWWQTTAPNTTGVPIVNPADGFLKVNWTANTQVNLSINRTTFNYTGDPFSVHLENASGALVTTGVPVIVRSFDRVHREYYLLSNITFYLDVGDVPDGFYHCEIYFWMSEV